jgi:hypothetical protein
MKFNELSHMMQKPEPKPDTYEAGMALNQLLKIGTHAIKIHNMIDDDAEMEAWVAKKIDLASNYVKSVHGYTAGSKAGTYDDDGMSEARLQSNWTVSFQMPKGNHRRNSFTSQDDAKKFADAVKSKGGTVDSVKLITGKNADDLSTSVRSLEMKRMPKGTGTMQGVKEAESDYLYHNGKEIDQGSIVYDMQDYSDGIFELQSAKYADGTELDEKELEELESTQELIDWVMIDFVSESAVQEDAGEGHMSKSQLYQTAKMAIELLDMINKGDDLEGWVQTKLNLAADYLQAVYHYEDYQKLNPYREELDGSLIQRHAGIIQKHLDEILERKCRAEDVDTKPGMMRILKKRVNEVEKEIAKENRKETNEDQVNEDPRAVGRALANLKYGKEMADAILKGKNTITLVPKAQSYISSVDQTIELLDKMYPTANRKESQETTEAVELEEGIREWGKRLAMAGIIVAGLAGVNSINNAIDNSVPAVKAMNTALEMAQDSGNDELAKMIEKDLSDAKVRLSSGKDLTHVADLQDKYAKFMKTEGLAYESKLAVNLKQRLK